MYGETRLTDEDRAEMPGTVLGLAREQVRLLRGKSGPGRQQRVVKLAERLLELAEEEAKP